MSLMRVPVKRGFVVHFQKNPNHVDLGNVFLWCHTSE